MAQITSHTLNGFDGTHAAGIAVQLRNTVNGSIIFASKMDEGGRLSQHVPADHIDPILPMNWFLILAPIGLNRA